MKIFISWSGERSRLVAELLSNWIQCVIQAVDPWLSSKDIDRGSLWFSEITNQLSNTQNGIVCLTKSNQNKPWILFEAGALAKGLSSNRVYTFLIDLNSNDIKDPLAQFNHTQPNKEGMYQLIRTINNSLELKSLKENILKNVFETYWPQFEKDFKQIIKDTKDEDIAEVRPKDDILNEILYSVRGLDKRLRSIEENDYQRNINPTKKGIPSTFYTPIEELEFSVRTHNVLKSLRVNNIFDFINLDKDTQNKISDKVREEIFDIMNRM